MTARQMSVINFLTPAAVVSKPALHAMFHMAIFNPPLFIHGGGAEEDVVDEEPGRQDRLARPHLLKARQQELEKRLKTFGKTSDPDAIWKALGIKNVAEASLASATEFSALAKKK